MLLVQSRPYIAEWLNNHPTKHNKESYVFITETLRNNQKISGIKSYAPLSYDRIRSILKKAAKDAGVDKPVNPHHFRHSEATIKAQFFTEAENSKWHGWAQGSKMPRIYVTLNGKEMDHKIRKINGLPTEEDDYEVLRLTKACPFCSEANESNNSICKNCKKPLDVQALKRQEEERMQAMRNMAEQLVADKLAKLQQEGVLVPNNELQQPVSYPINNGMSVWRSESGNSVHLQNGQVIDFPDKQWQEYQQFKEFQKNKSVAGGKIV